MHYRLINSSNIFRVSEPQKLYEIDLVEQWLNIAPGTTIESYNSGKVTIVNSGLYNKHEGPDIQDAILIIDEKIVQGSVECHLNTADWYRHHHQDNPDYNKVILHVVRKISNQAMPPLLTVVLCQTNPTKKECLLNYYNKSKNTQSIIQHFSIVRWLEKINFYNGFHENRKVLIKLLLQNSFAILGAGGNKNQFVELANHVDINMIRNYNLKLIEGYLHRISAELNIRWVKRGIRPAHQPLNRIRLAAELVQFISELNIDKFTDLKDMVSRLKIEFPSSAGKAIQNELLGNVFIPFYAARALYLNQLSDYHNYYKIWNKIALPNPYQKFVRQYGKIIPAKNLKSFAILQGLIAIENKWCVRKLCHICPLQKNHFVD